MGFIRNIIWTAFFIGVGVFISTYPIDGRTPLEHMQRAMRHAGAPQKFESLKSRVSERLEEGLEDAKYRLGDRASDEAGQKERHSVEDREALNRLIARRATNARE